MDVADPGLTCGVPGGELADHLGDAQRPGPLGTLGRGDGAGGQVDPGLSGQQRVGQLLGGVRAAAHLGVLAGDRHRDPAPDVEAHAGGVARPGRHVGGEQLGDAGGVHAELRGRMLRGAAGGHGERRPEPLALDLEGAPARGQGDLAGGGLVGPNRERLHRLVGHLRFGDRPLHLDADRSADLGHPRRQGGGDRVGREVDPVLAGDHGDGAVGDRDRRLDGIGALVALQLHQGPRQRGTVEGELGVDGAGRDHGPGPADRAGGQGIVATHRPGPGDGAVGVDRHAEVAGGALEVEVSGVDAHLGRGELGGHLVDRGAELLAGEASDGDPGHLDVARDRVRGQHRGVDGVRGHQDEDQGQGRGDQSDERLAGG